MQICVAFSWDAWGAPHEVTIVSLGIHARPRATMTFDLGQGTSALTTHLTALRQESPDGVAVIVEAAATHAALQRWADGAVIVDLLARWQIESVTVPTADVEAAAGAGYMSSQAVALAALHAVGGTTPQQAAQGHDSGSSSGGVFPHHHNPHSSGGRTLWDHLNSAEQRLGSAALSGLVKGAASEWLGGANTTAQVGLKTLRSGDWASTVPADVASFARKVADTVAETRDQVRAEFAEHQDTAREDTPADHANTTWAPTADTQESTTPEDQRATGDQRGSDEQRVAQHKTHMPSSRTPLDTPAPVQGTKESSAEEPAIKESGAEETRAEDAGTEQPCSGQSDASVSGSHVVGSDSRKGVWLTAPEDSGAGETSPGRDDSAEDSTTPVADKPTDSRDDSVKDAPVESDGEECGSPSPDPKPSDPLQQAFSIVDDMAKWASSQRISDTFWSLMDGFAEATSAESPTSKSSTTTPGEHKNKSNSGPSEDPKPEEPAPRTKGAD